MSGWGLNGSLQFPESLKWAKVQPANESACNDELESFNYGSGLTLEDNIVCALEIQGKVDIKIQRQIFVF